MKQRQLHDKIKAEYAYKKNISYLVLDCRPNMLSTINDKLCDFLVNVRSRAAVYVNTSDAATVERCLWRFGRVRLVFV